MGRERGAEAFSCCGVGIPGEGDSGRWKERAECSKGSFGGKRAQVGNVAGSKEQSHD